MKKSYLKVAVLAASVISGNIRACTIYFTNDTEQPVLIVHEDGGTALSVAKGKMKTFGSKSGHTCFHVLGKAKGKRDYSGVCTLRQYACSPNKKINIAMSDIIAFKIDTALFKVVKNGKNIDLDAYDKVITQ